MLVVALDRVRSLADRLDASPALDRLVEPLQRGVGRLLPGGRLKDGLHGVWLGHPLHPMLTDLPIGFWTSSSVFDLFGGRRARRAAELMVALGVASAVPTIAAGAADWSQLNRPEQRSGVVHAASNIVATALYGASFLSRRTGRHRAGVALGGRGHGGDHRRLPGRAPQLLARRRCQPSRRRPLEHAVG
jgi:hypothetical protein